MKLFLSIFFIPLAFTACFGITEDAPEEDTEEGETEETAETEGDSENETEEPPEVTPIDITSSRFISSFFNGSFEYRTISVQSSYDYMVNMLGEPSGSGSVVDGTYYHYDHIGFNFPESREDAGDTSELSVDGIVIFPEDFYKEDAVSNFGWPTTDDVSNFRMFYDSDTENDYFVMLNYDQDNRITEIVIQYKNLEDTELYEG